jgi:antirestriction protein ArdC
MTKKNNGAAQGRAPKQSPKERLKEITDKLEEGISSLYDSAKYKEYLDTLSKFHNYSFNNTLLIAMQKPDATYVAGFSAWKNKFKRTVNKGEKSIKIIAPTPFKVTEEREVLSPKTGRPIMGRDGEAKTEKVEVEIPCYKVVSVFDVSQTDGKELPSITKPLTGDIENFKDYLGALKKVSPVPISIEKIKGRENGYYDMHSKKICVKSGMSEAQTLKTMVHEIAHALIHDTDEKISLPKGLAKRKAAIEALKQRMEVEAESVAYVVCQHFGLDSSDYSFGYVAGWGSKGAPELKASLETIKDASDKIIDDIEKHLALIGKANDKSDVLDGAGKEKAHSAPTKKVAQNSKPSISGGLESNKSSKARAAKKTPAKHKEPLR